MGGSRRKLEMAARRVAGLPRLAWRLEDQHREWDRTRTFHGIAEIRRRLNEPVPNTVSLRLDELRVFSQNGEDGVIVSLIRALGVSSNYFVEFGVGSGSECNTRLLAEVLGWGGALLESEPEPYAALATRYANTKRVETARAVITPDNVNHWFSELQVPHRFGVLSIDIDGQDYWVWKALSERYEPSIVVIEYNSGYSADVAVVEQEGTVGLRPESATFGASLGALAKLGEAKGYDLVHVDLAGVNAFFVKSDLLASSDRQVVGVTDQSPNYYLAGTGHPEGLPRPGVKV